MLKDSTGDSKAREAIMQAISALEARGDDINAHSVAAEAKIPRSLIISNADFMALLTEKQNGDTDDGHTTKEPESKSTLATNLTPEDIVKLQEQLAELEAMQEGLNREVEQAHWENQVLRRYFQDSQAENKQLRDEIARMKQEAEAISKSVHIAWQQGYLAGQQAAAIDSPTAQSAKSFVDSLKEAANAATSSGITEDHQPLDPEETGERPAMTDEMIEAMREPSRPIPPLPSGAASEATSDDQDCDAAETESLYVADVPLQISDPEVLKDPFTAKLLNALGGGDLDDEPLNINPEYEDPSIAQAAPSPLEALAEDEDVVPATYRMEPEGFEDIPAHGNGTAAQHDADEETPTMEMPAPGADELEQFETAIGHEFDAPKTRQPEPDELDEQFEHGEHAEQAEQHGDGNEDSGNRFTADELHSLFRNRYVKGEEPPPLEAPAKGNETSQPTKKFVGTKHSSTEPLPAVPRSFPPDIRKACRLLGVQPEELTRALVIEAWKKEMAKPGVHPDTGGDTEMAIYLNTAKDTLIRWVEGQTPKLGKKFGHQGKPEPPKQQPEQAKPEPAKPPKAE